MHLEAFTITNNAQNLANINNAEPFSNSLQGIFHAFARSSSSYFLFLALIIRFLYRHFDSISARLALSAPTGPMSNGPGSNTIPSGLPHQ